MRNKTGFLQNDTRSCVDWFDYWIKRSNFLCRLTEIISCFAKFLIITWSLFLIILLEIIPLCLAISLKYCSWPSRHGLYALKPLTIFNSPYAEVILSTNYSGSLNKLLRSHKWLHQTSLITVSFCFRQTTQLTASFCSTPINRRRV